ncbi:SRPBCC domain-containing protein [Bradyrhizobium sp. LHD-71]|uniref:SRPBCC family protein n=1 Tax=Bradyrhizobium sp. LHD-71 TaxID=3072141 RepID=UPI00280F8236|nr:SRPBCC domain-containing protein [Bradyrhizobium sp. LHD-71]MDQ8731134.1 SRPBCC domain-containing protein [Bradyrhizobium sp. LHD-71]
MPIKKDGTGKRWVEMEFIAPGTPEQVWEAMATGAGNTAWFTKAVIEEQVGGAVRFDFGEGTSTSGEVTAWEPPHRFGYVEREWSEGAPPVATEITITSRSGDRCVVRMVHSLFSSSDDWDDQMEGFEGGWPGFFEVLRIYLSHFAGRKAASFQAMVSVEGNELAIWKRLTKELNLVDANVGEVRTASHATESLSGVIERVQQDGKVRVITMRLDAPAPGVVMIGTYGTGDRVNVSMFIFFYGDDAQALVTASDHKWRSWLTETLSSAT